MTAPDVLDAVDKALLALEAAHGRSAQRAIGASEIGKCARLLRWTLDDREWTDGDTPSMQAEIGTALHARLLEPLVAALDDPFALVERAVTADIAGLKIPGTLDAFAHSTVIDLKTKYALDGVRRYGPDAAEVAQVATYALALEQAGETVRAAAILYVDRAHGERLVVDLDRAELDLAIGEVTAFVESILAGRDDREDLRGRHRRGPDLDYTCGSCPFRTACWGDPPKPSIVLAEGRLDVTDALAGLLEASTAEAAAKKDREWWKAVLEDVPAGVHGDYRLKRNRDTPPKIVTDVPAAEALLRENGLEVPAKWDNGRRGAVSVIPVEAPASSTA